MAQENILVTGKHGSDHITSAQMGAIQAGFIGSGSYINTGLEATVTNANTITVGVGVATVNGRSFVISTPTDLTVTSGMTGKNRNDLIVLHYEKDSVGAVPETGTIKVITGTPTTGTAVDPTYTSGNILNGDTSVDFPLYRVEVRGIDAPRVVAMAKVLPSIGSLSDAVDTLGDSISHLMQTTQLKTIPTNWKSQYFTGYQVGSLCVVSFNGPIKVDAWKTVNIASGLPKPRVETVAAMHTTRGLFALGLQVKKDGWATVSNRGDYNVNLDDTWAFGDLMYVCD